MATDKNAIQLKAATAFPESAFRRSIQEFPAAENSGGQVDSVSLTLRLASFTDTVPQWGGNNANLMVRDRYLADFWKSESTLSSAIFSVSARNAAFDWQIITKNARLEKALTDMFHNALAGHVFGWIPFIAGYSQDLYTQDNGGFIEIIREPSIIAGSRFREGSAPVIGIGHLESSRCFRTGNPKYPVIYTDEKGIDHKMPWWSVISTAEFPSALRSMRGAGFCSVSRVLRMSQILREIAVYKNEKVSGRFVRQIHFVGGVSKAEIEDVMQRDEETSDNRGMTRFSIPTILASLDPEKPVTTASIDLAALPDNFSMDEEMRWYISGLALGLGVDYQDFAPLPSSNMGSGSQSEILHRKSRGKGPALFMNYIQNIFRYYGVIPRTAEFRFVEKDMAQERDAQELRTKQSEELAVLVNSKILTPNVGRRILLRRGYIEEEEFNSIEEEYGVEEEKPDAMSPEGERGPQRVGNAGGNTNAEDARRTEKSLLPVHAQFFADPQPLIEEFNRKLDEHWKFAGNILLKEVQEREENIYENIMKFAVELDERHKTIIDWIEQTAGEQRELKSWMESAFEKQAHEVKNQLVAAQAGGTPDALVNVARKLLELEDQILAPETLEITSRDERGFTKTAIKRKGNRTEHITFVRDENDRTKKVQKVIK